MKPSHIYRQNCSDQGDQKKSPAPLPVNFGSLLLLPALFFQSDQLITWVLLAVVIGIVLIFILITFILLPLSRRAERKRQERSQADIDTRPMQKVTPQVEADPDETIPTTVPISEDGIDTVLSFPAVQTVAEPGTVPISGQRPPNIGWQIAGLTDVGLRRELNEDNMIMIEDEMAGSGPYGIYVIADGLGGHEAGEVASQLTVEAIQKQHADHPPTTAEAPFEEWLKSAVVAANEAVLQHQGSEAETGKMGSTLVMALVTGENAHIVNVGDSRAYHLNSEKIEQITVDHSLVERLVQIGQLTREEARTHKQRNVVYSIIGEKRKLEIGYYHITLEPGERLLLCSDGLSNMVADEELQRISHHQPDPAKANQMMIEAAKQAGGHDNITTIIVQMDGDYTR